MINPQLRIVIISEEEKGEYTQDMPIPVTFYFISLVVGNDYSLSFVHFCYTQILNNF